MKLTHSLSIPLVPHLPLTREQMRKQEQEQKRERKTGSCVEVRGTGNKVALGLRDKPGLVWDRSGWGFAEHFFSYKGTKLNLQI